MAAGVMTAAADEEEEEQVDETLAKARPLLGERGSGGGPAGRELMFVVLVIAPLEKEEEEEDEEQEELSMLMMAVGVGSLEMDLVNLPEKVSSED